MESTFATSTNHGKPASDTNAQMTALNPVLTLVISAALVAKGRKRWFGYTGRGPESQQPGQSRVFCPCLLRSKQPLTLGSIYKLRVWAFFTGSMTVH
jgi:hypothetical protein